MGADGGICYIGVKNKQAYEEFMRLAGWLVVEIQNKWAWGYRYPHSEFYTEPTFSGDWSNHPDALTIEGAYGTDCDYSLQDFYEFVKYGYANNILDGSVANGGTSLAEYSFAELKLSYLTRPEKPKYDTDICVHEWWRYGDVKFLVEYLDNVPDSIKDMTLGDWSERLNSLLVGFFCEETWT